MNKDSFPEAMAELLREAFEGARPDSGTWIVDGKNGILPLLKGVTAEQASVVPANTRASIAAHARHITFVMTLANMCHGGNPPNGTWEDTWKRNDVTTDEWLALQAELQERYENFATWMRTNDNWVHEMGVIGPTATLPHVTYHLGAIMQLVPQV